MEEDNVINIVWLRRDLRLDDNTAIQEALKSEKQVLLLYVFDKELVRNKSVNHLGLNFVYDQLQKLNNKLSSYKSSVLIKSGDPISALIEIFNKYQIKGIYANEEYEPYTQIRDKKVTELCIRNRVDIRFFKDQVNFGPDEVLKADGTPYQVYTSYKNKWLSQLNFDEQKDSHVDFELFYKEIFTVPTKKELGLKETSKKVRAFNLDHIQDYHLNRDFPYLDAGSYLGIYLRYGAISIRDLVKNVSHINDVFLSELIWREFFMQIMYHYPHVIDGSFKKKYDFIKWENNENMFLLWQKGQTGYPIVDAGMRELNETGYMHNRVRMITASFLCKHLLIDWRWGEAYFASKLQDYELAANNGNWQWVAGTGCDAAPYFRVFNPITQQKKFDSELKYVKMWVPEFENFGYAQPIVEHSMARKRAIETYKLALK